VKDPTIRRRPIKELEQVEKTLLDIVERRDHHRWDAAVLQETHERSGA
jgi:hypothetical protein